MNFFSHAVLAAKRSEDPEWILGSMAPDFASMAGLRLLDVDGGKEGTETEGTDKEGTDKEGTDKERTETARGRGADGLSGALVRGVEFHHRSDDAFHGAPIFVELMENAREELEDRGLGFGPAAAIGHVGVELALDGWLVDELGEVPESYRAAVAVSPEVDQRLRFHGVDYYAGCRRWRDLCSRLRHAPVPEGYREAEFVSARLIQILARRPRLAVQAGDEPEVLEWARRAPMVIAARAPALFAEVEERLLKAGVE